jgi:hypothetical protein
MKRLLTVTMPLWLAAAMVLGLASTTQAQIDPAARALAQSVSAKLGSAQTLRLTAKHNLSPVSCYVLQPAGDQTRELAFDGRTPCLMQPMVKRCAGTCCYAYIINGQAVYVKTTLRNGVPIVPLRPC